MEWFIDEFQELLGKELPGSAISIIHEHFRRHSPQFPAILIHWIDSNNFPHCKIWCIDGWKNVLVGKIKHHFKRLKMGCWGTLVSSNILS